MKWNIVKLGDVCKIVSGATPKTNNSAFWDGNVPWITPKDLSGIEKKHINDTFRKITDAGLRSCSANILPPYSVLFSSRAPIGLVAINTIPVCTNQGFKSMVPQKDHVSHDYLYWWLKSHRQSIEKMGRGATFKEVSKKIVEEIQIPLPPLTEQKRIAAILDAADAMRAKRREAIALLDTLLQSTFLEMFGGSSTNYKGHPLIKLGDAVTFRGGGTPNKSNATYWSDEIPWATVKDFKSLTLNKTQDSISKLGLESSSANLIPTGHVIIPTRMSLGKAAINTIDLAINQDLKALIPKHSLHPKFLLHAVLGLSDVINQNGKGATVKGVTIVKLSSLEIPFPSIDFQSKFVMIVEFVEQQKALQRAHLTELDALFASLQQRAFNGELSK